MRRISSGLTGFYQLFFVPLWVIGFGAGVLMMYVSPESFSGEDPRENRAVFFLIWIFASAALIYWIGRLVSVDIDGDSLIFSRFQTRVKVRLLDIAEVHASRFSKPERMTLELSHPTEFGTRVVFLPPYRMFPMFRIHPLRQELLDLIREVRHKAA